MSLTSDSFSKFSVDKMPEDLIVLAPNRLNKKDGSKRGCKNINPIDMNGLLEAVKQIQTLYHLTSCISKNLLTGTDDLVRARITVAKGFAVERRFDDRTVTFNNHVVSSECTYIGMTESLKRLLIVLEKDNKDVDDVCVLCIKYKYTGKKSFPGGDTQAGGGGKLKKKQEKGFFSYESFTDAVKRELQEELRVKTDKISLLCESTAVDRGDHNLTSSIYGINLEYCEPVKSFITDNFADAKDTKEVVNSRTLKVGFVPWGTTQQCLNLVKKISIADPREELIDGIDTISFVALKKAIEMTIYADQCSKYKRVKLIFSE